MTQQVCDIWESSSYRVDESEVDSEVDGKIILARVTGPAFFPGAISGNDVEYPEEVWDETLSDPDVVKKIEDRLMLGTIGHDEKINDDTVRKGLFSHIVTRLWVGDDGIGYGEYLILNTPVGQVLNTLLRAKCKLRVSTKAKGILTPPNSQGIRTLKQYFLERVDFVTVPGFEEALPSVVESLESLKSIESATQAELDPVNEEHQMDKVVELLEQRLAELKTEVSESKAENKESLGKLSAVNEALVAVKSTLAKYEDIGKPEEISEALAKAAETIRTLRSALDSVSELSVNESLVADNVNEELESYRDLGTLDEINQLIDIMESLATKREEEVIESLRKEYKQTPTVMKALVAAFDGDLDKIEEALKQSDDEADECNDTDVKKSDKKDDTNEDNQDPDEKDDKKSDKSGTDDDDDNEEEETDEKKKGKGKVNESLSRHNRLYGTSRQLRETNIVGKNDVNENKQEKPARSRALQLMGGK